jgi:hypothetical protein
MLMCGFRGIVAEVEVKEGGGIQSEHEPNMRHVDNVDGNLRNLIMCETAISDILPAHWLLNLCPGHAPLHCRILEARHPLVSLMAWISLIALIDIISMIVICLFEQYAPERPLHPCSNFPRDDLTSVPPLQEARPHPHGCLYSSAEEMATGSGPADDADLYPSAPPPLSPGGPGHPSRCRIRSRQQGKEVGSCPAPVLEDQEWPSPSCEVAVPCPYRVVIKLTAFLRNGCLPRVLQVFGSASLGEESQDL